MTSPVPLESIVSDQNGKGINQDLDIRNTRKRPRYSGGVEPQQEAENFDLAAAIEARLDHFEKVELAEARRAGLVPCEVDENGNEIIPPVPDYKVPMPWLFKVKQIKVKKDKLWFKRDVTAKYPEGAFTYGGAMTHSTKSFYDPKSRSIREDNLPNADPGENFYEGENQDTQGALSQAELSLRNLKVHEEPLTSHVMDILVDKFGDASTVNNKKLPETLSSPANQPAILSKQPRKSINQDLDIRNTRKRPWYSGGVAAQQEAENFDLAVGSKWNNTL